MKFICRAFAALAVFAALAASSPAARAQQPNTETKVAIIDSGAFSDEKSGIVRLVNIIKQIETQFQPLRTELQGLQTRQDALLKEIQDTRAVASPQTLAQKQEQSDQLQLQIKRKQEDAQAAYQKRLGDALTPLQQDVTTALNAYAQARGISVVIDVSRVPVIYAADSANITRDFIIEYNRTHPATTTAAAGPGRP
jgi:Skp family chaperone for outer membrane proteins